METFHDEWLANNLLPADHWHDLDTVDSARTSWIIQEEESARVSVRKRPR